MPSVFNKSTVLTDDEVKRMVAACDYQMKQDFAPRLELTRWTLDFNNTSRYIPIYVVDKDTSVPDALAYHDFDGRPVGVILADTIRQYVNGPDWKFGPDGVSVALSHEYLELRLDAYCNELGDGFWKEACDAVQGYSYSASGSTYVSDFCTKTWWTKGSEGPWDFMRRLSGPQKIGAGGYQVHYNLSGETTVYGDKPPYHGWRALSR